MYDFSKELDPNEEILYQGSPAMGKGSNHIIKSLILLTFSLLGQALMIWNICVKIGDGEYEINTSFIFIFLAFLLFGLLALYSFAQSLWMKISKKTNIYYCVTNQRVLEYRVKKDKLIYGYIENFDFIKPESGKYGDVHMYIKCGKNIGFFQLMKVLKANPRFVMLLRNIENPVEVANIIKEAKCKIDQE